MSLTTALSLFGFPTLFVGAVGYLMAKSRANALATKAIQLGVQALLRDRLYKIYGECDAKGYATLAERENFENLYLQYHSLGQNGVMDDTRQKFLALEMEEDIL